MLTMLLLGATLQAMPATPIPATATVRFVGRVPLPSCKPDSYTAKQLAQAKTLHCPDQQTIDIQRHPITTPSGQQLTALVLTYDNAKS
ncbi:hypothetical protein [Aeromonas simiae]|uniref:hypothetical protein n=1 Tax=Aeromonas simiae TaxID=218936 RepID=UPI0005A6A3A5|nr:hypothetical protein [Aeromonas simiae]